ncbi:hypothetical protein MITS9509_00992 [Synechococcus sp. MIT S9509]|nr:hypothetical protein MITS9509_00992 [Synechococcus sp. MIT S9509]
MSDFFADTGAWFEQGFIDIGNVILGNSKAPDNDPVTGVSEVDVRHDPVPEHSATDVGYGPVDDTYFDSITNIDCKPTLDQIFSAAEFTARNLRGDDPSTADVMYVMEIWIDSGFLSAIDSGDISIGGMDLGMNLHFLAQVAAGQQEMPLFS